MRPSEGASAAMVRPVLAAVLLMAASQSLAAADAKAEGPALKDVMPKGTLIGVALNQKQSDGQVPAATAIVARQFNSVTAENLLKWEKVHPEPARYDFGPADRYVEFAEKHGLAVIGHCLLWHNQTPAWVFAGKDGKPLDRETALSRLKEHIHAVAGRYKGKVKGWDVVNEAINDDAQGSLRQSKWQQAIGDDYIEKAFEFAREADPNAELYYNDYNLTKAPKRATAIRIAKNLRAKGLRIDAIGEQGHWLVGQPSLADIEATITDIAAAGFKVVITEMDLDVLPRDEAMYGADLAKRERFRAETNIYVNGLPPEKQQELAKRYADVFAIFKKHQDKVTRVTLWGLTDGDSWLNGFPIAGRVNHPLPWDREHKPKPALDAIVKALQGTSP